MNGGIRRRATAWSRNGSIVFVDYSYQSDAHQLPNLVKFYFYADGGLAKMHIVLNALDMPAGSEGKLMVVLDRFYDDKGNSLAYADNFLDPRTR